MDRECNPYKHLTRSSAKRALNSPGTGKTSTIIEIIVQLVRRDASVRVLTCTPNDATADLLVERLAATGLDSDKLYHLNPSPTYEEDMTGHEPAFPRIPGHERLLAFRVVLSTCSKAAILQNLNIPVGHFSHIVIDDAAQAEEPLVMIPIMTFSNTHTNVILAGDPNQLSPAVKSPTAARSGLGTSYFERLMLRRGLYGLDTHVGKTCVMYFLFRSWLRPS
jgi:helicase MOV-10